MQQAISARPLPLLPLLPLLRVLLVLVSNCLYSLPNADGCSTSVVTAVLLADLAARLGDDLRGLWLFVRVADILHAGEVEWLAARRLMPALLLSTKGLSTLVSSLPVPDQTSSPCRP